MLYGPISFKVSFMARLSVQAGTWSSWLSFTTLSHPENILKAISEVGGISLGIRGVVFEEENDGSFLVIGELTIVDNCLKVCPEMRQVS